MIDPGQLPGRGAEDVGGDGRLVATASREPRDECGDARLGDQADPGAVLRRERAVPRVALHLCDVVDESSPADRSTRCRVAVDVLTRVDGIPAVDLYAAHNRRWSSPDGERSRGKVLVAGGYLSRRGRARSAPAGSPARGGPCRWTAGSRARRGPGGPGRRGSTSAASSALTRDITVSALAMMNDLHARSRSRLQRRAARPAHRRGRRCSPTGSSCAAGIGVEARGTPRSPRASMTLENRSPTIVSSGSHRQNCRRHLLLERLGQRVRALRARRGTPRRPGCTAAGVSNGRPEHGLAGRPHDVADPGAAGGGEHVVGRGRCCWRRSRRWSSGPAPGSPRGAPRRRPASWRSSTPGERLDHLAVVGEVDARRTAAPARPAGPGPGRHVVSVLHQSATTARPSLPLPAGDGDPARFGLRVGGGHASSCTSLHRPQEGMPPTRASGRQTLSCTGFGRGRTVSCPRPRCRTCRR